MSGLGSRFAINTYSYSQTRTAADTLRHLADLGVTDVELMFFPGHLWTTDSAATMRDIAQIISSRGLNIVSVNGPNIDLNIAAAADDMREMSLRQNEHYLRIGGELGASGLILGPGKANPLFSLPVDTLEGHFHRALDRLIPAAERSGVELWVENMPFAFLPRAEQLMASLARHGGQNIRICYDVTNAYFISEDPVSGLAAVAPKLAVVHVSDTTRQIYRHDAIGDGDMDFSPIPAALELAGYHKPVVLEVISHHADRDLARSVDALTRLGF